MSLTTQLTRHQPVEGGLETVIGAKAHRVISDILYVPSPEQVHKTIVKACGWPYRDEEVRAKLLKRDRAFIAMLYSGALRVSELSKFQREDKGGRVMRDEPVFFLKKGQLKRDPKEGWYLQGVRLVKAKTRRKGKEIERKHTSRDKVYLPLDGERAFCTDLLLAWAEEVQDPDAPLFDFKRKRAWQIVKAMTGQWNHYFRMLGENYLYVAWGHDVMALSEYLQVHPRTLMHYLRGDFSKMPKV